MTEQETMENAPSGYAEATPAFFLSRAHALRRQGDFDSARSLLETALAQSPDSQEIKALLLQTEKDQLTASRMRNKGDYEIVIGPIESSWRAIVTGFVGVAGAVMALFMIGETVVFMARHGFAAQQTVYTKGTLQAYSIPAYSTLALPLLLFCFCVWAIKQAVKSFRS